jgi:hypothetical protein
MRGHPVNNKAFRDAVRKKRTLKNRSLKKIRECMGDLPSRKKGGEGFFLPGMVFSWCPAIFSGDTD